MENVKSYILYVDFSNDIIVLYDGQFFLLSMLYFDFVQSLYPMPDLVVYT